MTLVGAAYSSSGPIPRLAVFFRRQYRERQSCGGIDFQARFRPTPLARSASATPMAIITLSR
jgi:hypothetical protein